MKGLVIVICGPSQAVKDYIADELMRYLAMFDRVTSYASVYKIREPRTTDGKHVKCIASLDQVDVQQEDRVDDTLFGNQTIIYDKKEIKQKLERGEIVFIATVSPQLAKKVKAEFGKQCYSVFVKAQQVSKDHMLEEDLKRHGVGVGNASVEQLASSKKNIEKRMAFFEQMKPEMIDFVRDKELGADFIFRNIHTLMGGPWNSIIDEMSRREFGALAGVIMQVQSCIQQGRDWSYYSLSDEERTGENLFTLLDVWSDYISRKDDDFII